MTFYRVLRWGFVGMLGATAVMILLILSGVFDPKPIGELVVKRPLFPQIMAPQAPRITWLEETTPVGSYTVRLTAAQMERDSERGMDVGYGLVLGKDDANIVVAVSPLGNLSVWQETEDGVVVIKPWQPWPHVGRDTTENEIWIDVDNSGRFKKSHLTIRINREFLWEGEIDQPSGHIGVIAESFGETAVVDYKTLEIFEE